MFEKEIIEELIQEHIMYIEALHNEQADLLIEFCANKTKKNEQKINQNRADIKEAIEELKILKEQKEML